MYYGEMWNNNYERAEYYNVINYTNNIMKFTLHMFYDYLCYFRHIYRLVHTYIHIFDIIYTCTDKLYPIASKLFFLIPINTLFCESPKYMYIM